MIPPCLNNMKSLRYVDLSHNKFEGSFIISSLANLSKLEIIAVTCDGNELKTDAEDLDQNPLFHLKLIKLSNCNLNKIPRFLLHQHQLRVVDLSHNQLNEIIDCSAASLSGFVNFVAALLLGNNHLSGLIPKQLCELDYISIMDLSNNFFYGPIPPCFYNITFWNIEIMDDEYDITLAGEEGDGHYVTNFYRLEGHFLHFSIFPDFNYGQFEIDFVTKNRHNSYTGDILNFMSGLDLSCNNLTGQVPSELGHLSSVHALNLSHNRLVGSIPISFSNRKFRPFLQQFEWANPSGAHQPRVSGSLQCDAQ
ncbi:hypothetical protein PTKIN_Ptkin18bG0036000 [Pterospermum kingtungense]